MAIIIIIVSFICNVYNDRRVAPSIGLGILAGIIVLVVTQSGNTIALPNKYEIGSRAVIFILIAVELALAAYIFLMYPTQKQVVVEPAQAIV